MGATLILAHGASGGQRSPFMTSFAQALAGLGIDTVTFDFPYMEQGRRIPDRREVLEACYRKVVETVGTQVTSERQPLFIGGKSMGGRIATQIAADDPPPGLAGLVLIGYPLHPPGKPEQRRDGHLPAISSPVLIVQGSRDTFGTPAELEPIVSKLAPRVTLSVVIGGDHSLKVPKTGQPPQVAIYGQVQRTIAGWMRAVMQSAR
jgi:predicted alpha/beta-hydrolase family hydrolase